MTFAQLYAGDGATTGLNGRYGPVDSPTFILNVTTTLKDGVLALGVDQMQFVNGVWTCQAKDLSLYLVMSDGRIMTDCDQTLDGSGNLTAIIRYHGPCLLADAGAADANGWKSSVAGGGDWEWHQSKNPGIGAGTYYFEVDSSFDAALLNGSTFQKYASSGDGGKTEDMETIDTIFVGGVCTRYAQQATAPVAGPVYQYVRWGDRR